MTDSKQQLQGLALNSRIEQAKILKKMQYEEKKVKNQESLAKWDKFREQRQRTIEQYIAAKGLFRRMTDFRKHIALV